jgi:SAM-dependent methyltransferase
VADVDALTEHARAVWSGAAPAWSEQAEAVDDRCEPITLAMLDGAGIGPGHRVLELAGGPGGLGMEAAARVGAEGRVLITDVADAMVETAARRARDAGLDRVETALVALDAIDLPASSFDAVVCREGLMFAGNPAGALSGMLRVLRPGGRVAVSVWAEPASNPWLSVLLDSVSEHVGMPIPPPGVPGPFSLADPDRLVELLTAAGFDAVDLQSVAVPCRDASFDDLWSSRVALAGPLRAVLDGMPDDDRNAIRERAAAAAAPYATATGGYEFPGLALVGSGTRPAD